MNNFNKMNKFIGAPGGRGRVVIGCGGLSWVVEGGKYDVVFLKKAASGPPAGSIINIIIEWQRHFLLLLFSNPHKLFDINQLK